MTLDYNGSTPRPHRPAVPAFDVAAYGLAGYFALSTATLPLARHVWAGDLPILAVVQLPKVWLADWIRTGVVVPLIRGLGLSRGSFSPDYGRAAPYALVAAYLIPILTVVVWRSLARPRPARRPLVWLLATAAVDLVAFEVFTHTRGLSIY